jgi:hypothetical protein
MAATPSIKITKSMPYKGGTRTWSNRYHFNGGTPADSAHWTTFSDAIVTAEKAVLPNFVTITGSVGYAAGSDVPVFSKTYSTAGTLVLGTSVATPGDCAALVRYSTTARTPKNHPIYLFNYYHAARGTSGTIDQLDAGQKSSWISGFSDGTNTLVRAGPNGATATGQLVETYITHRDFPR